MCQEIRFPRFKCRIYARNRIKITRVIKLIPPVILKLDSVKNIQIRPSWVLSKLHQISKCAKFDFESPYHVFPLIFHWFSLIFHWFSLIFIDLHILRSDATLTAPSAAGSEYFLLNPVLKWPEGFTLSPWWFLCDSEHKFVI